jgi:hypothetical protein
MKLEHGSAVGAEGLAGLDDRNYLHFLVADRAHVVVQGLEVREQFVDLSALVAFLERNVRGLEQIALIDAVFCPLQADISDAVITKAAPTDVDPHMLADLNSCQFCYPCLMEIFFDPFMSI